MADVMADVSILVADVGATESLLAVVAMGQDQTCVPETTA